MAKGILEYVATDHTGEGIKSVKKNMAGLEKVCESLGVDFNKLNKVCSAFGVNLGKVTAVGATVAALKKLGEAAKKCCEDFLETETTYLTLKAALGDTSEFNKANSAIIKLSRTTLSSREDIAELYTTLVQLGKSDEEINKIITASISLANVTGKSLTESFNVMLDSLDGSVGTLQKYLPEVKNMTKEELALGAAVDATNAAFSETAQSVSMKSYSQTIKNIKDDVQTISEEIGGIIFDCISPVLESLERQLRRFVDDIQKTKEKRTRYEKIEEAAGAFDQGSTKDQITELFNDLEGAVGFENLRFLFHSTDEYLREIITDNESALDAYETLQYLIDQGLMEETAEFNKMAMKVINEIAPNTQATYETQKAAEEAAKAAEEAAKAKAEEGAKTAEEIKKAWERDPVWGEQDDFKNQVASSFSDALTSAIGSYTDNGNDGTYTGQITSILEEGSYLLKKFNYLNNNTGADGDLFKSVDSATQANMTQFEAVWKEYADAVEEGRKELSEKLGEILTSLNTQVTKTIANYSTYLRKDLKEKYDEDQQQAQVDTIQDMYNALVKLGKGSSEEAVYLKNILDNIENGVIPNLDVSSFISSNNKYIDEATKSALELEELNKSWENANSTLTTMKANQDAGVTSYTQAQMDAAQQIVDGFKAAIDNYGKEDSPTASELISDTNSALSSYSTYMSSKLQEVYEAIVKQQNLDYLNGLLEDLKESDPNSKLIPLLEDAIEGYTNDNSYITQDYLDGLISANISLLSEEVQEAAKAVDAVNKAIDWDTLVVAMENNKSNAAEDLDAAQKKYDNGEITLEELEKAQTAFDRYDYSEDTMDGIRKIADAYWDEATKVQQGVYGIDSYISSNSKYLSDESLKEQQISLAEEQLAKTDEYLENLKKSDYYDEDQVAHLEEIKKGQEKELEELRKQNEGGSNMNWGDFTGVFSDAWSSHFDQESIDASFISDLSSSFGGLLDAMGPVVEIFASSNPLLALLMQIVTEMCEDLAPFIKEVLAPLNVVISLIADSLASWLIPILKAVEPIITLVAKGLAYIAVVFDFVGDAIWYAIANFLNFLATKVNIFGWKPFEDWYVGEPDEPDWDRSYSEIMGKFNQGVADASADTSTSTSVSTASYTGANNYYFNIYQQAPVVGDGGMQEFAKMIKSEFAELAYLSA